tara:strand:+ start:36773 stop:37351 length:579 start_codon:yes stop_codon:yes gene_type:complete
MNKNIITISAPSGSGKTTLCKALRKVREDILWSVSYTTREPRKNENNGLDYYFISKNQFKERIKKNNFIEWQNVHGNYYGTPRFIFKDAIKENKILLFEVDVKGALSLKENNPENTFTIFILPPSLEDLRIRLIKRGSDSQERIEIRLNRLKEEMKYKDFFDFVIINKNLSVAKKALITKVNQLTKGEKNVN